MYFQVFCARKQSNTSVFLYVAIHDNFPGRNTYPGRKLLSPKWRGCKVPNNNIFADAGRLRPLFSSTVILCFVSPLFSFVGGGGGVKLLGPSKASGAQ